MAARSIFEWLLEVKPGNGLGATLLFSKPPEKYAARESKQRTIVTVDALGHPLKEEEPRDAQIVRAVLEHDPSNLCGKIKIALILNAETLKSNVRRLSEETAAAGYANLSIARIYRTLRAASIP
jgi:hypothetical protein